MAFILKDNQVQSYNELWDYKPASPHAKGYAAVHNDVFGFQFTETTENNQEAAFVYDASQVEATKLTGTGEAILAGQKVYATLGSSFQSVTASVQPGWVIGTDYYYCGVAKRDAAAGDATVLIRFIGTSYNHADEA